MFPPRASFLIFEEDEEDEEEKTEVEEEKVEREKVEEEVEARSNNSGIKSKKDPR